MAVLNERIKERRETLGLSQADLANRLGYSDRSTIAKIESGINDITQSKIEAFAQALETTPGYLMGWDQELIDLRSEELVLSLLCKSFNLPQEALFFEDCIIKVKKEYEHLLPPGWREIFSTVCRLFILNSPTPTMTLNSIQEFALFTKFMDLNDDGRKKLLERAEELIELPKYRMDGNTQIASQEVK